MKHCWLILTLLLVVGGLGRAGAATVEETKLYRVGQTAFDDRLYELAESQLAEFVKSFPGSEREDSAYLLLGQAQLNQGKWQGAVKTFQQALEKWPKDKRPDSFRFWLAEALTRGEMFADAETFYSEVIEKYPRSVYRLQAHYGLAYVQFKQGKMDETHKTLEALAKLQPKGELAQETDLLRGRFFLARLKFEKADAAFAEVTNNYPGTLTAYRSRYWLGESLSRQKQFDEALKQYGAVTDAFQAKPGNPVEAQLAAESWYGIGWTRWHQEQFATAAEAFAEALTNARSPQLKRDALLKVGEAFARAGKTAEAVAKLKFFLQVNPVDSIADEVQMAIGDLPFAAGDFAAALPGYAELIIKYPQSKLLAQASYRAGWCAWKLKRPADALPYFKRSFELVSAAAPEQSATFAADVLFKLADTQFELRQFTEAITSYQRLINSYPTTKLMDRALFQLAQAYQQIQNPEAATAAYESLVKQYLASEFAPPAQMQVALIQVGLGREDQARAAFAVVVEKFPGTEWAKKAALAIGESFYREGQFDQACAEFEKLFASEPETVIGQQAFYHLGWCHASQGKTEKTLEEFGAFLVKFPQSALAADVQFWIADYYARQRNYLKAQEQYQLIAKNHASSKLADAAQYMAARAAYSRQDYKAAIELFEALVKNFPDSPWRCDARFGQGDALTELNQYADALLVFDSLIKQFPECLLACEAQGRKGDCQFTLAQYDDAIVSYRSALQCAPETDVALRNHLHFQTGRCYEALNKMVEAFESYSKPVYVAVVAGTTNAPPERFWLCKCGLAGGSLKEQQQQWRDAITIYQRTMDSCPDLKPLIEEKIRKLRVEHLILF